MMKWILLGILIGFALSVRVTHAGGVDGLFAEQFTKLDGVTVRRIRDVRDGVDCYVATGPIAGYMREIAMLPAISCVKVDR